MSIPMYVLWHASPYPVKEFVDSYFYSKAAAERLAREMQQLGYETRLRTVDVPMSQ